MSPTFSYGRQGQVYRYYVSAPLQQGQRRQPDDSAIRRVPASALEEMLARVMRRLRVGHDPDVFSNLSQVEIYADTLHLLLPAALLYGVKRLLGEREQADTDPTDKTRMRLILPLRMQLRGGRTSIAGAIPSAARLDPVMVKALRAAHAMVETDNAGMPSLEAAPDTAHRRRLVRLAFLAPALQKAILAGTQPPDLTLARLIQDPTPLLWSSHLRIFPPTIG